MVPVLIYGICRGKWALASRFQIGCITMNGGLTVLRPCVIKHDKWMKTSFNKALSQRTF